MDCHRRWTDRRATVGGAALPAAQQAAGDLITTHIGGALIIAANRWRALARFGDPTFANHLGIARGEAAGNAIDLVSYGGRFAQELFTTIAMSAALWHLHPLAPLLLLLAHIPQALQENTFGQKMADAFVWHGQDERKLASYAGALMGAEPAKDVRLFGLGGFFRGLHGTLYDQASGDVRRLRQRLIVRMIPAQLLSGAASALVYLYVIARVLNGAASLGDLVLYGGVLLQLEGALQGLGFEIGFIAEYFTSLPSLFVVLDAGPDLPVPPPERAILAPRPIRSDLVLGHVSFHYPGPAAEILYETSRHAKMQERHCRCIVSKRRLRDFWVLHPEAEGALRAWYKGTKWSMKLPGRILPISGSPSPAPIRLVHSSYLMPVAIAAAW